MRKLFFGLFLVSTLVLAFAAAHAGAADCPKPEQGLPQERILAQGLLSLAQSTAGSEIECVGKSQAQSGDVHTLIFQGQEPGIEITITGAPVENMLVLSSKVESDRILYTVLDTDRASAIEIELKKSRNEKWEGSLTDIGEPGNPSRTWKLSCN